MHETKLSTYFLTEGERRIVYNTFASLCFVLGESGIVAVVSKAWLFWEKKKKNAKAFFHLLFCWKMHHLLELGKVFDDI